MKKFSCNSNNQASILLLMIVLTLFFIPTLPATGQGTKRINLESIFKEYQFYPARLQNLESMNDGMHYTVLNNYRSIDKYAYKSGEKLSTILNLEENHDLPFEYFTEYRFNSNESLILLTTDEEAIYRHSSVASYYIYTVEDKSFKPLSGKGKQQLATFSPDGQMIAFVRNNNLFVTDLKSGTETQLTLDGERNRIINGAPDWVYEEEFGFSKGFEWSPDSRHIAYYRFDETRVKEFNMTVYNDLYPEWYSFKYPKAGEENSLVSVHVVNVSTVQSKKMDTGSETDPYIPRIKWTRNPAVLSIMRLNRLQNQLEILHSDIVNGTSEVVYEETETEYIAQPEDDMLTYLPGDKEFLIKSERSGWKHFYLYNFRTKSISAVSSGNYDVNNLIDFDEARRIVYYTSSERSPLDQDVYAIRTDGKQKRRISIEAGWNEVSFSKGFTYFILSHNTINKPDNVGLYNISGKFIRTLEDNHTLLKRMEVYGFTKTDFFNFTTSDSLNLTGYIIKPAGFDETKKYPVFMYVYGGPESQNVVNRFNVGRAAWFQMLAQQGYIVVCVDNRGTNGRGEAFRKSTYLQLGKYETLDQIEAAKYLGNLPYVDKNRIGIFGWSYGGYMSLLCLFKGDGLFSLAVSVAPVTNWRFYDTIYTERFMRKPQDNAQGYDENSPINFVEKMKGKLLLIHGMADDNVHFQNSVELTKALTEAGKQFEMQFYPNKNHGIYGGNTSLHVYTRITDFIIGNL